MSSQGSADLYIHLSQAERSFLVSSDPLGHPHIVHWGRAVDEDEARDLIATASPAVLNSSFDHPRSSPLVSTLFEGTSGTPSIEWHTLSGSSAPFVLTDTECTPTSALFSYEATTPSRDSEGSAICRLRIQFELDQHGILCVNGTVENGGDQEFFLQSLRFFIPLPRRASEVLDFTGRWSNERVPQRHSLSHGTWARQSRRGKPGHDSPFISLVGTPGFSFHAGEIWACHVAWSGNQENLVEQLPEGAGVHASLMGGGELLLSGEMLLRPGETYASPRVLFAWSDCGLDGISAQFHGYVRSLPSYPRSPRPLTLNTWEAVYFDHDPAKLQALAHAASRVGVERFVLDDGWFQGRRNDTAGLGDWYVDTDRWPQGLGELSRTVHSLGMEFGLWFEPEMINMDSVLARSHPEWVLSEDPSLSWRHQFALNIAHPDAYAYVLERICSLVQEYQIDYLKWDHNRDLHASLSQISGRHGVHEQTRALYRLFDDIHRRFPTLEIESCSSGGARVDLGILEHTHRIWASDTIDPLERHRIHMWTQMLVPPELIGAHVGSLEAHTTHRMTSLPFRLTTALFYHAGIEWNLLAESEEDLALLTRWAALYRKERHFLHSGRCVRSDDVDSGCLVQGVVSPTQDRALVSFSRISTSPQAHTARTPLPGVDPLKRYRIQIHEDFGSIPRHEICDPRWVHSPHDFTISGRILITEGIPLPQLNPGQELLISIDAVPTTSSSHDKDLS